MTRPMTRIVDAITGEVVDREMNDEELARFEADNAYAEEQAKIQQQRDATKQSGRAKLKALGLTDDEIAALIP